MMLQERADGTQMGENVHQEPDEKPMEAEREKTTDEHAKAAKGGAKGENSKTRRHPVADVG